MWKDAMIFLVLFPGAILTGMVFFYRKWRKYPTGEVVEARAEKRERERVEEARKELRRLQNGG